MVQINAVYGNLDEREYAIIRMRVVSIDEVTPRGDLILTLQRVDVASGDLYPNTLWYPRYWCLLASGRH